MARLSARGYIESGCKGTAFSRIHQIFSNNSLIFYQLKGFPQPQSPLSPKPDNLTSN